MISNVTFFHAKLTNKMIDSYARNYLICDFATLGAFGKKKE
jgi:hypothetical protein